MDNNNNNNHYNFQERHRLFHHSESDGISIDVPAFDLREALDQDYKPTEWTIDAIEHKDEDGKSFDTLRQELSKYKIKLDVGEDSRPCVREQVGYINQTSLQDGIFINHKKEHGYIDRPSETLQQENLRFLWSKLLHHLTFHRGEINGEILLPPVQTDVNELYSDSDWHVKMDIGELHKSVVNHEPVEPVVIMKHHLANNLHDTFILPVIIYCRPCRDLRKMLETDTFIYSLTGYSPLTSYAYHANGEFIKKEGDTVFVRGMAFEMAVKYNHIHLETSDYNDTMFSFLLKKEPYKRFIDKCIESNVFEAYHPLSYPIKLLETKKTRSNGHDYHELPSVATDNLIIGLLHLCRQLNFRALHRGISTAHANACREAMTTMYTLKSPEAYHFPGIGVFDSKGRPFKTAVRLACQRTERKQRQERAKQEKKERAEKKKMERKVAREHRRADMKAKAKAVEYVPPTVVSPPDTDGRKEALATLDDINKLYARLHVKRMRSFNFFASADDPIVHWKRIGKVLHDKQCSGVRSVSGTQLAIRCKQCERGNECTYWNRITKERVREMVLEYAHELCAKDVSERP